MSVQTSLTALANAVRSKSGTTANMTIDQMTDNVNGIFSAFFCESFGSGETIQTYTQVPFEPDIVMMSIEYGITNPVMVDKSVFTVLLRPGYNRYREKISSSSAPQERNNLTTITSEADGNGTYTVKIYCNGSTFPSRMDYMCMLGKSKE